MAELLLELFSEEIPAGAQAKAVEDFKRIFSARFEAAGIKYKNLECYTTPRRVVVVVDGLPTSSQASVEERRGPRVDAPAQAIDGFLKSTGLAIENLEKRETPKGEFYFAVIKQEVRSVSASLVEIIQDVISGYTWPKSMKWGSYNIRWIRPLHSILCLFNGNILPVSFGHLQSGNITRGHRFLGNEEFTVKDFADYEEKLRTHYVILKQEERKQIIHHDSIKLAHEVDSVVRHDDGLLAEVANLVEWPVVLLGRIEEKFMHVPPEVLIVTLRSHQRYFSLLDKHGKLAHYFITVSNIISNDGGAQIINGNERVLRARLEDAKFFWDQDRRHSLESRLPALEKVIFHVRLGTVAQKVNRIVEMAQFISVWVPMASLPQVGRAAKLCKADLATGMVGEFPELQGLMGSYYAVESKESDEVATAIKEHYSPVGASDLAPNAPISIAVAIADKVDSLVGLFAIDEKPTGSRDPYALRRAALGVIRIILENNLRIPLKLMLEKAIGKYPDAIFKTVDPDKKPEKLQAKQERILRELMAFFADRLRASLKDQDVRHDIIEAVFNDGDEDDFTRLVNKAKALSKLLANEDGVNLLAAYKRATNIVQIEEKKDNTQYRAQPSASLLVEESEKKIFSLFNDLKPVITEGLKHEKFEVVMQELAKLRKPVDAFFENVKVNCEDSGLRKNRLLLLAQFREFLNNVANFSKIEG